MQARPTQAAEVWPCQARVGTVRSGLPTVPRIFSRPLPPSCLHMLMWVHPLEQRRLMGRAASHVTLECALQTHPQMALISEEVETHKWSLADIAGRVRAGWIGGWCWLLHERRAGG